MITVLTVRGTAEQRGAPTNLLSYVTRLLDPTRYAIGDDVDYPASVGPVNPLGALLGPAEEASRAAGVTALAAAIRACPNVVVPLGYSLGAQVVSDFLELRATGEFTDCEIAWAGLVSNPSRALGEGLDADATGWGINGEHGPWPADIPVLTVANPADAITCCPAPLRLLADGIDELSLADFTAAELAAAVVGLWGYAIGGQHNTAYITGGRCQQLAAAGNAQR